MVFWDMVPCTSVDRYQQMFCNFFSIQGGKVHHMRTAQIYGRYRMLNDRGNLAAASIGHNISHRLLL
jgi:hypothetical protein